MKNLSSLILLVAGLGCAALPAAAEDKAPPTKKAAEKKPAPKKQPAKAAAEPEPDVAGMTAVTFDCELGNKLTIYNNASDDQQIALRWNKKLHPMTRVGTTTGAQRFENTKNGLVWIGIPAKGMLLDSKKGQQLANECRNIEQAKVAETK